MRKDELCEIMIHLWNNVDQAGKDFQLEKLMKSAPVNAQKKFIEDILYGGFDTEPDEEILAKAKKLVGFED